MGTQNRGHALRVALKWLARSWPPHPAEPAEDLPGPRPEEGGRRWEVGQPNLAGEEERAREEAQHQGVQGDFTHPWATTENARPAGVVGRQWLGDNEW